LNGGGSLRSYFAKYKGCAHGGGFFWNASKNFRKNKSTLILAQLRKQIKMPLQGAGKVLVGYPVKIEV
jgi:hypothetical protein